MKFGSNIQDVFYVDTSAKSGSCQESVLLNNCLDKIYNLE